MTSITRNKYTLDQYNDSMIKSGDALKNNLNIPSVIAGDVKVSHSINNPIIGAVVNLNFLNQHGNETLIAQTLTNKSGQFTFSDVAKGNYIIRIKALGYLPSASSVSITNCSSIAKVIFNLNTDPQYSKK